MKKISRLVTGAIAMAAAAALVSGTVTTATAAPLEPPKGVTPMPYDLVGVGSATTEFVIDQISVLYNKAVGKAHSPAHPYVYSFDALPPGVTTAPPGVTYTIKPKLECNAKTPRPNGSGSGAMALATTQGIKYKGVKYPCLDFARSSSAKSATSPAGVTFVEFARDALTWATRSAKAGGSNAPASLTLAQLKGIYHCTITNWSQVGGKPGVIKAFLPQTGSGTRNTWLTDMGLPTKGTEPGCLNSTPEENEGTFAGFNNANVIFPYSIGAYVAQVYHSGKGKNLFGSNISGRLALREINKVAPLTSAKVPTINPKFPGNFWRNLYNVVLTAKTADKIPPRLERLVGKKGFLCTNKIAKATIADYGFVNTKFCGSTS